MNDNTKIYNRFKWWHVADCACKFCLHYRRENAAVRSKLVAAGICRRRSGVNARVRYAMGNRRTFTHNRIHVCIFYKIIPRAP